MTTLNSVIRTSQVLASSFCRAAQAGIFRLDLASISRRLQYSDAVMSLGIRQHSSPGQFYSFRMQDSFEANFCVFRFAESICYSRCGRPRKKDISHPS